MGRTIGKANAMILSLVTHLIRQVMALTPKQLQTLAHLARLELKEEQVPALQTSLSSILDFVSQLDRAATEGVTPMSHPLPGLAQRLRADELTESDRHETYQRNAPQVAAGLYLVPKVIE
jgi:aspartyl-tRNA(Asn)/glutamyl-tRNA(Gln) amidotransferase subunit C